MIDFHCDFCTRISKMETYVLNNKRITTETAGKPDLIDSLDVPLRPSSDGRF
jgi:hypothetical protein